MNEEKYMIPVKAGSVRCLTRRPSTGCVPSRLETAAEVACLAMELVDIVGTHKSWAVPTIFLFSDSQWW